MKKVTIKGKFKNFFNLEENYEYTEEIEVRDEETDQKKGKNNKNVINLSAIQQSTSKVVLYEPKSYDEVQEIADNLLNNRAVVINLQRVDHVQAKRIVDFLSGTVYSIDGDIQKLGLETFLCTPDTVDVTGTISKSLYDEEEIGKGW